jgi:hypothetical protein
MGCLVCGCGVRTDDDNDDSRLVFQDETGGLPLVFPYFRPERMSRSFRIAEEICSQQCPTVLVVRSMPVQSYAV